MFSIAFTNLSRNKAEVGVKKVGWAIFWGGGGGGTK